MQPCQWAGVRLLRLNDHEGLWSKKEEFWRNKQNGDFLGKPFCKRDFLPFPTNIYFRKKCFKRDFLQRPICGKKIEKPSFLLTKAIDVLKNIQGL